MPGILEDARLQQMYRESRDDLAYYSTADFWHHALHRHVFNQHPWFVSIRYPPPSDTSKGIDLELKRTQEQGGPLQVLIFKAKPSTASNEDVSRLETEAAYAGHAHCNDSQLQSVWMMTVVGPAARLWVYVKDEGLMVPFVPESTNVGDKSLYLDFLSDQRLYGGLLYIKEHPFTSDGYVR
jgi:hypothetical protein